MYNINLTVYSSGEQTLFTGTFAECIQHLSTINPADHGLLTRHSAVLGPVSHMDAYFDIYNEGAIIIEK